jgi:hypothetical protein
MSRPLFALVSALPLPAIPKHVATWTPGLSPLSTHTEVATALAVYLSVIFTGAWLMADRKAFSECHRRFSHAQDPSEGVLRA